MKYPRVESTDARLLVRSLGLLLNQAAVYGPFHNVTKTAITRVYDEVLENLDRYSVLEFTVKSNLICVNGFSEDLDSSVSSSLVRRFAQLDINGLLFVKPLPARDFERSIKILSMPIAIVTESSGVQALLMEENIKSVSVVNVDYCRVDIDEEEPEPEPEDDDSGNSIKTEGLRAGVVDNGIFDLSAELMNSDGDSGYAPFNMDSSHEADKERDRKRAEEKARRKEQSAKIVDLLRKTAEALESNSDDPKYELAQVVGALETVRSTLMNMSRGSQMAITSFAQDVDQDKDTIAGLEADAKRRGFSLKLTREDILYRYAELNQEIVQPLTVSTGVIEMLRKNQAGSVSEKQDELLKLAHESIERVNELVNYINAVTGLPDSFNPDTAVIEESHIYKR